MKILQLIKPSDPSTPKYDPIRICDSPLPVADSTTTLIRIVASALNHRDIFIRQGLYPRIKYGSTLGSDGAGVDVESGRRVLINPSVNWKEDPRGPEDPEKYGMLGLLPFPGTLAEYITVPSHLVHPIPAHLTFTQAAALPLAGLTAWRATMSKAGITPGQKVLIPGIGGGVALFALQFAVAAGAEVYVTSSDEQKIQRAISMGAKGGVSYRADGWTKKLQSLVQHLDAVIDGAGGDESLHAYIKLLRVGGKLVTYGSTVSPTSTILLPSLFLKQISWMGSTMGNEAEFADMLGFVEQHKIVPVVSQVVHGLEHAEGAFESMRTGKHFGKIVVEVCRKGVSPHI
ncbi:alcohol dehydrogenase [Phlyctochytrium arcticum]|nr:alcohol dehydrogenase [Phlyctochytrium arcticum]